MKKNIIVNGAAVMVSFGFGMLAMHKITKLALSDYNKKNYNGGMDKYKDNEVIMNYYNNWKNNR